MMTSVTVTAVGWTGIVLFCGAYYLFTRKRPVKEKPGRTTTRKLANKVADVKSTVAKELDIGQPNGDLAQTKTSKKKKKAKAESKPDTAITTATEDISKPDEAIEDLDNREFARQLQSAKSGSISNNKPQTSAKQKSIKQSRANDGRDTSVAEAGNVALPDTLADSPSQQETARPKPSSKVDVSDMLESPSAGASVLRITEPANPQTKKAAKAATAKAPELTQRQRQYQKKKEAEKALREEQEKERVALMEKQRRTARLAEGRAAKDGSEFMASLSPKNSVWTGQTQAAKVANGAATIEPLDTIEPTTSVSNGTAGKAPPKPAAGSTDRWDKGLPSEEEQLRQFTEEAQWEPVVGKKGKKKPAENSPTVIHSNDKENQKFPSAKTTTRPVQNNLKRPSSTTQGKLAALEVEYTGSEDDDDVPIEERAFEGGEWEVS